MPAGSPFTKLCQRTAPPGRADLHVHTTFSDGTFTPAEVVARARKAGLFAVAVTDHDTLAGVAPVRLAARAPGPALEVVAGVEVTAEDRGRELHLLGYFVRPDDGPLNDALDRLRRRRVERVGELADLLRRRGLSVDDALLRETVGTAAAPGRRHLALYLVKTGQSKTVHGAFTNHLSELGDAVPKARLPVTEAARLVRGAGGVASWAHPPAGVTADDLARLRDAGVQAVEAEYAARTRGERQAVRELAERVGLAVTGGSDCHGPTPATRAVGAAAVSRRELDRLRALAAGPRLSPGQVPGIVI